jgi:prepilin-type N-terminal cleavage/methylation domain-containing protein
MFKRSLLKKKIVRVIEQMKTSVSKGFTIAELTVVVGIIGVVTTIALANQASLSNNVLLSNLAYEIGLSLREAQTYGISVKAGDSTAGLRGAYGILFRSDEPLEYYLFHDRNDNKIVDEADGEIVDTYKIENQRGNSIVRMCFDLPCNVNNSVGDAYGGGGYIAIMFRRPNPEPVFKTGPLNGASLGASISPDEIGPVHIVVNNQARNNCKTIIVESTGQIRVDSGTPDVCVNP